ncbi:MAG: hypothetical protein HZB29_05950 [Nitrospinae bacterium]|nr:hypothetical protein [Nitrospinota bacterium]
MRKKICFTSFVSSLPTVLLATILSMSTLGPKCAEASWLLDLRALAERNDNINNTKAAAGMKTGTAYIAGASLGYFEQIATYTGASIDVDLENATVSEYDGLSRMSGGLSLNLGHKFGVGPQSLRMDMRASYRIEDFKDNHRDINSLTAGLTGSLWATERLNMLIGYEYDRNSPRETFEAYCGSDGKTTDCSPGSYSNPYDTSGNTVLARLSFLLTEADNLIFEYRFRRGEVAVDFVPGASLRNSRTSIWYDHVFSNYATARYQADTQSFNIGLSREIYRQFSLNLDYLRVNTNSSWANYENNIFRFGAAYAF